MLFKDVVVNLPKVVITLQLIGITVIDEKSKVSAYETCCYFDLFVYETFPFPFIELIITGVFVYLTLCKLTPTHLSTF